MNYIITLIMTISLGIFINTAKAQQPGRRDSIKRVAPQLTAAQKAQRERNYYRQFLNVDSAKAEEVNKVQQDYKSSMKAVEADQSLNLEAKRARYKALIEAKNKKMEKLLNAEQQAKLIPASERGEEKKPKKD